MTDLEKIRKGVEELESNNNCGTDDFIESKRIAFSQVLKLISKIEEEQEQEEKRIGELQWEAHLKGEKEGQEQLLKRSMDEETLTDWYCNSTDDTIPPRWTPEHITELLKDFYVIPKKS